MQVIFMQGFVNQVQVFYTKDGDNNSKIPTKGFTIKNPISAIELIELLSEKLEQGSIKTVTLVGNTGMLKDIEDYYKNLEGVNIIWQ